MDLSTADLDHLCMPAGVAAGVDDARCEALVEAGFMCRAEAYGQRFYVPEAAGLALVIREVAQLSLADLIGRLPPSLKAGVFVSERTGRVGLVIRGDTRPYRHVMAAHAGRFLSVLSGAPDPRWRFTGLDRVVGVLESLASAPRE